MAFPAERATTRVVGATLKYRLSETFFDDLPVIDSCIYQMLDDFAADRR
jgi:hypothetical protein